MKRPILTPLLIGFSIFVLSVLGDEISSLRARIDKLEGLAASSVRRTGNYRPVMVPCSSLVWTSPSEQGATCATAMEVFQ